MCTAVLISWVPATPPLPPHLDSYTRALFVSKDRRHLFVTPCSTMSWLRVKKFLSPRSIPLWYCTIFSWLLLLAYSLVEGGSSQSVDWKAFFSRHRSVTSTLQKSTDTHDHPTWLQPLPPPLPYLPLLQIIFVSTAIILRFPHLEYTAISFGLQQIEAPPPFQKARRRVAIRGTTQINITPSSVVVSADGVFGDVLLVCKRNLNVVSSVYTTFMWGSLKKTCPTHAYSYSIILA